MSYQIENIFKKVKNCQKKSKRNFEAEKYKNWNENLIRGAHSRVSKAEGKSSGHKDRLIESIYSWEAEMKKECRQMNTA